MKNGWPTKRLGDVCEIIMGQSPDGDSYNTRGEGVPLINGPVEFSENSFGKTIRSKFTTQPTKFCKEGDLILCVRGSTTGRMNIAGFDACVGRGVAAIRAKQYQPWINHFISSKRDEIHGKGTGATFPNVSGAILADFELVVPPLPEQRRIVGILDEAFEGIAKARANVEKNLQNARTLFESYLQSVFTQRGKEWDRLTLETLLDRGWITSHLDGNHGGDYPRKEEFIREGVPYISANCLDDEGVDMSRAKYLSPSRAALLRKGIARDNDVLFAHNATVGPVAILRTDEEKVILGTSLTYYRCNPKHILPEYLAHYMRSFGFKTQYLQVMRQSTRNQVPITKQREFYHVIPPLEEQKRIIGALNGLLENSQLLVTIYQRKLVALEALKKSLLHQAFTGKL